MTKRERKKRALLQAKEMPAVEIVRTGGSFYEELLEFAVSLANKLQACGAETYRVEETINHIIEAYGVERADAFVIPGSIMASLETDDGQIITKIRRLKSTETLLDGIERYSALSRRVCETKPSMREARKLLKEDARRNKLAYSFMESWVYLFGEKIDMPEEVNEKNINLFLKKELKKYLEFNVREYETKMKINEPYKISVRNMKTRYGSNSLKTHTLSFQQDLVHFSPDIINSVIVHELAH